MKIEKQKRNDLLERKEILLLIESKTTSSKEEIKEELSKKLKKEKQNIVINKIDQKFGSNKFDVDIFVYDSYEGLKKYNKIPKKTKAKLENPDAQSETAEQS